MIIFHWHSSVLTVGPNSKDTWKFSIHREEKTVIL